MLTRKSILSAFAALALSIIPIGAKDSHAGFDGKWVLDKHSSKAPEVPDDLRQEIRIKGSDVTIQSQFKEPANGIAPLLMLGIMVSSLHLTTDGQEIQNQIGPFAQTSKTTLDGNKMETEWNAVVNGDQVQGHWTRTLADDGKRMTLHVKESSTKGQGGDTTLQFVRK